MSGSDTSRVLDEVVGEVRLSINEGRAFTNGVRTFLTCLGLQTSDAHELGIELEDYDTELDRAEAELDALNEMAQQAVGGELSAEEITRTSSRLAEIRGARALRRLERPASLN
ncbi:MULTISPECIES: hypothetical protein [unclassified Methylobacterium]|uniref:hypothetical protein n=1 Tax=unclassified Methylobacterium TaxID=2615210 RepID=UPI0036F909DF